MKGSCQLSLNGWIIYNGNLPGDQFLDFASWFHLAADQYNIPTTIYKNNQLLSFFSGKKIDLLHTNESLPGFVIFTDKDVYLAKQLELLGVRVFNSAKAIEVSDNKITTYQVLAQHNIRIPQTVIAPKIFYNHQNIDVSFLNKIIQTFGFPMIIKEAYGSFGEQVYLIHTKEELIAKVHELNGKSFVFQEFISTSYGKDIRLHVVGDKVIASMLRTSTNDFRANISAGGHMEPYAPTDEEKTLAIKATQAVGADFAGVDILFGPNRTPIVCEVNSNAHIRNMYNCTKINVANYIIDYIIKTLRT